MSDGAREMDQPEIYHFPEFFERLDQRGSLRARDAVDSYTEVEGLLYHHRGLQVPAYSVVFLRDPTESADGTFRVEVSAVGERAVWASFDRSRSWDVYVVLFDGGAVVAWMSDAEFEAEESDRFESKAAAILAGQFSFGTLFVFGPDWVEREEWAHRSDAPALLQLGTGHVLDPESVEEFWELHAAIPPEFRPDDDEEPPEYLGVVDCGLSVDTE